MPYIPKTLFPSFGTAGRCPLLLQRGKLKTAVKQRNGPGEVLFLLYHTSYSPKSNQGNVINQSGISRNQEYRMCSCAIT